MARLRNLKTHILCMYIDIYTYILKVVKLSIGRCLNVIKDSLTPCARQQSATPKITDKNFSLSCKKQGQNISLGNASNGNFGSF